MPLTGSGQLKISEIATEFGDTAPHEMSEFYGAATGIPASGEISVSDFYGASAEGGGGGGGEDITSSFYEISNRFIASNTYMGSSADYSGPYDVGSVTTDFSGTGRIYIGVKVTAVTTYYNDIPIEAVQLLNSSGTVKKT